MVNKEFENDDGKEHFLENMKAFDEMLSDSEFNKTLNKSIDDTLALVLSTLPS